MKQIKTSCFMQIAMFSTAAIWSDGIGFGAILTQ
jgi:hypothetical protein